MRDLGHPQANLIQAQIDLYLAMIAALQPVTLTRPTPPAPGHWQASPEDKAADHELRKPKR